MPQNNNNKNKNTQKKPGNALYVIPPLSPVVTRSGSHVSVENKNNSSTPTLPDTILTDVTSGVTLQADASEGAHDWCRLEDGDPLPSCGLLPGGSAIFPVIVDNSCQRSSDLRLPDELVSDNVLIFITPALPGVMPVNVYRDCIGGTCSCVHFIGKEPTQLKHVARPSLFLTTLG